MDQVGDRYLLLFQEMYDKVHDLLRQKPKGYCQCQEEFLIQLEESVEQLAVEIRHLKEAASKSCMDAVSFQEIIEKNEKQNNLSIIKMAKTIDKLKQELSEKVNNKVFDQNKKDLNVKMESNELCTKKKLQEMNKNMIARLEHLEHLEKTRSLKQQDLQQTVHALQKCISEIQRKETSSSYYSLWQKKI
jgi:hypothetical protein